FHKSLYVSSEPLGPNMFMSDISPESRNYKGIAISLLVIVAVCSLITMSVFVLTPGTVPTRGPRDLIGLTVLDLFKPEFSVHDPEARWISDSEVLYRNRDGHVIKFNFALNETEMILRNSTFVSFKVAKYSLSPDMKYVLFAYEVKQVGYEYSTTDGVCSCLSACLCVLLCVCLCFREVWELNPPEVQNAVLQHAAWGVKGQQLIYIFENNIYYQSDVQSNSLRITSSGEEGVIFNGIADWLYEEEILQSHIVHWWSPDGERLAFLMINDTLVPNMFLPRFTGSPYPRSQEYPYPKAGQPNPTVRLLVVNLYGPTHTQELVPPDGLKGREHYVSMVKWISNTHAAVRWLNRPQNGSFITVCDATVGSCVQKHEEASDLWLTRQNQEPVFSKDGSRFFLTIPVKQGGQGDFHHIAMFTKSVGAFRSDQNDARHLTSGNWEVTKILAYDEGEQTIYFIGTQDSPQKRHVYSASTIGLFSQRCLTCEMNQEACTFFDADISPNKQHVILQCKGTSLVCSAGHALFLVLSLSRYSIFFILITIVIQYFLLTELPLKLTYPLDFSESLLYGLLLIVDGGPGSQSVSDEYELGWDSVLVSCDEVIVARLDGRGTGFRGLRVLQQVHQRLGTVDVQDQIAALECFFSFQGYGAYLTLMLLRSTALIKCAAANSPVVDWKLYGELHCLPCLFSKVSRVLPNMKGLQGNMMKGPQGPDFLLIHGTADANVHFQHSAELIKHLIKVGANYTMQLYPDEGHFLSLQSQQHLSESLVGYFRTCFQDFSTPLPEEIGKEDDD
uniref:Dipeptidyl-peptidase 10 (Non-functional) n=1 Tax=Oncorhynchus mykiss TaxID=8022 RepID=A0A8C7RTQ5_ONCMY